MNTTGCVPGIGQILRDAGRVLVLRPPSPAIATHSPRYLAFGLAATWLAGIGRYWDNPRADAWQHAGLGSLAYVLVLAALLWLLCLPLRPRNWRYRNVLLFVTLTSPLAWLYAIPVERFLTMDAAQDANVAFLAVVATWRVALLAWFLARVSDLRPLAALVATLLPLTLIVVTLTALNLEHVVFNLMGGLTPGQESPNDAAYGVVMGLAVFSVLASPVLLVLYGGLCWRARSRGTPSPVAGGSA